MNSCSILISLFMHSLQLIFFENWVRWSQKVYPEPEILWVASAWSESKLLRNTIWWIRVATNLFWAKFCVWNFYLWKPQSKKFHGVEIYLLEPYAWSLQRKFVFILWANKSVTWGTCFYFGNFWKLPYVILSKEWVSGTLWIVLSLNRPWQGESQKPHGD